MTTSRGKKDLQQQKARLMQGVAGLLLNCNKLLSYIFAY